MPGMSSAAVALLSGSADDTIPGAGALSAMGATSVPGSTGAAGRSFVSCDAVATTVGGGSSSGSADARTRSSATGSGPIVASGVDGTSGGAGVARSGTPVPSDT